MRHAIARALATHNCSPAEATWRVLSSRASVDARGRVIRADVSVRIEQPLDHLNDDRALGLVNPTGQHPLMAVIPGQPATLLDIFPVSWDRWLRLAPGSMPAEADGWTVRTGVSFEEAGRWAKLAGKRLPTPTEVRSVWGRSRYPWGAEPDPAAGLAEALRYNEIPQVALFPPNRAGFFDIGTWLWMWLDDGSTLGGAPGLVPGHATAVPVSLRCAADLPTTR